ncbi:TOMM precursor leader peptide-binding protein [Bacillus sp. CLL-7-23]|uniref:TOMM leader peptide-binding protein n=1 Tax=Bacillus changyiensis TaxID=3004103 RepID=A0ABT4XAL8_9BACI|nr:TOMM precursor leader peptide-binding protein [Bacillus changyiensis]MDA7028446.1 TOMM precursor leader peptide-binding protein [Bacillus changyiensis]
MEHTILLIGDGVIADGVLKQLSAKYKVICQPDFEAGIPNGTQFAIVVHDACRPCLYRMADEKFRQIGIPWLRGFVSFGEGIIGPFVDPANSGCSQCADMRRMINSPDSQQMRELEGEIDRDPWASRNSCRQMILLICKEIENVINHGHHNLENRLLFVNMKTLESSFHSFIPDPLCPICSCIPEDTPELALLKLQPNLKTSIDRFRVRDLAELKSVLKTEYLDQRTGIFNSKRYDAILPFADMIVNMPLWIGNEAVGGRSHSYEESELTAILEGLERYSGIEPRGKQTTIYDCYEHLETVALDPRKVGLHDEKQYQQADFPFKPFDPHLPMNWVWGYSFLQERPILIPETLAYYSLGRKNSFVYETSNGCALGSSLEEAIFHAILEVVERDSFLITWYAQLPLQQLDLKSCDDQELQFMLERIHAVAGYDLHVYNSTMEHGIPSIWAIAKNKKAHGLNLICTGGAHLNPIKAVKSACHELAGMMLKHDQKFTADRDQYLEMLSNPFLVQKMEQHSMLYGLPEAENRLQFLLNQKQPLQTFKDAFKLDQANLDLSEDLRNLLEWFHRLSLEVIVVDQTSPAIKRNGLYCVKVLIPGMLPMTFGHRLTRLTGLERVLTVPRKLGFTEEKMKPEQLNQHPHPFP